MPISSKTIEISGPPTTGVGLTPSQGTMHNSLRSDRMKLKLMKLRRDNIEKESFQMVTERNYAI